MEDSSSKRMKIFIELRAQNYHHCLNRFSDMDISFHMVLEQVLYPSDLHLFKTNTLYVCFL